MKVAKPACIILHTGLLQPGLTHFCGLKATVFCLRLLGTDGDLDCLQRG